MKPRPVLRYFGGKHRIAPWIIEHLPPHRVYVEPFGGAASVLMRKERSYAEVYNDIDSDVVNLFRVLRVPESATALKLLCELTPFSRDEFDMAYEPAVGPIERARRLLVRSFMGYGANGHHHRTGFKGNDNKARCTTADSWVTFPDYIPRFCERLQGVVIENDDALELMRRYDRPDTLHYVDPPYPLETRGNRTRYSHEMTEVDHAHLLAFLTTLNGKFVLSGYMNDQYEMHARMHGWRRVERETLADGARKRTEVLWLNF